MKLQKSDEPFDMSVSHEFEPSAELVEQAQKNCKNIKVCGIGDSKADEEATEKMHKCRHDRLWRFSVGMPSNIIGCCDCDYWRFF